VQEEREESISEFEPSSESKDFAIDEPMHQEEEVHPEEFEVIGTEEIREASEAARLAAED